MVSSKNNSKEFYILVALFILFWRVPLLFISLGIIESGLWAVLSFFIAKGITIIITKFKGRKK